MPFKILLVDDQIDDPRTTIAQLKQLLEDEGYDVRATSDGTGAYDIVFEFKPDVIVLDINFGAYGNLGIDICKALRTEVKAPGLGRAKEPRIARGGQLCCSRQTRFVRWR